MNDYVVFIESTKIAIKKIIKELQESGGLSDYMMTLVLESILADYRSMAAYEYITAQVTMSTPESTEAKEEITP